jgi:hypothetical protein
MLEREEKKVVVIVTGWDEERVEGFGMKEKSIDGFSRSKSLLKFYKYMTTIFYHTIIIILINYHF